MPVIDYSVNVHEKANVLRVQSAKRRNDFIQSFSPSPYHYPSPCGPTSVASTKQETFRPMYMRWFQLIFIVSSLLLLSVLLCDATAVSSGTVTTSGYSCNPCTGTFTVIVADVCIDASGKTPPTADVELYSDGMIKLTIDSTGIDSETGAAPPLLPANTKPIHVSLLSLGATTTTIPPAQNSFLQLTGRLPKESIILVSGVVASWVGSSDFTWALLKDVILAASSRITFTQNRLVLEASSTVEMVRFQGQLTWTSSTVEIINNNVTILDDTSGLKASMVHFLAGVTIGGVSNFIIMEAVGSNFKVDGNTFGVYSRTVLATAYTDTASLVWFETALQLNDQVAASISSNQVWIYMKPLGTGTLNASLVHNNAPTSTISESSSLDISFNNVTIDAYSVDVASVGLVSWKSNLTIDSANLTSRSNEVSLHCRGSSTATKVVQAVAFAFETSTISIVNNGICSLFNTTGTIFISGSSTTTPSYAVQAFLLMPAALSLTNSQMHVFDNTPTLTANSCPPRAGFIFIDAAPWDLIGSQVLIYNNHMYQASQHSGGASLYVTFLLGNSTLNLSSLSSVVVDSNTLEIDNTQHSSFNIISVSFLSLVSVSVDSASRLSISHNSRSGFNVYVASMYIDIIGIYIGTIDITSPLTPTSVASVKANLPLLPTSQTESSAANTPVTSVWISNNVFNITAKSTDSTCTGTRCNYHGIYLPEVILRGCGITMRTQEACQLDTVPVVLVVSNNILSFTDVSTGMTRIAPIYIGMPFGLYDMLKDHQPITSTRMAVNISSNAIITKTKYWYNSAMDATGSCTGVQAPVTALYTAVHCQNWITGGGLNSDNAAVFIRVENSVISSIVSVNPWRQPLVPYMMIESNTAELDMNPNFPTLIGNNPQAIYITGSKSTVLADRMDYNDSIFVRNNMVKNRTYTTSTSPWKVPALRVASETDAGAVSPYACNNDYSTSTFSGSAFLAYNPSNPCSFSPETCYLSWNTQIQIDGTVCDTGPNFNNAGPRTLSSTRSLPATVSAVSTPSKGKTKTLEGGTKTAVTTRTINKDSNTPTSSPSVELSHTPTLLIPLSTPTEPHSITSSQNFNTDTITKSSDKTKTIDSPATTTQSSTIRSHSQTKKTHTGSKNTKSTTTSLEVTSTIDPPSTTTFSNTARSQSRSAVTASASRATLTSSLSQRQQTPTTSTTRTSTLLNSLTITESTSGSTSESQEITHSTSELTVSTSASPSLSPSTSLSQEASRTTSGETVSTSVSESASATTSTSITAVTPSTSHSKIVWPTCNFSCSHIRSILVIPPGSDPQMLDTLIRSYWEGGNVSKSPQGCSPFAIPFDATNNGASARLLIHLDQGNVDYVNTTLEMSMRPFTSTPSTIEASGASQTFQFGSLVAVDIKRLDPNPLSSLSAVVVVPPESFVCVQNASLQQGGIPWFNLYLSGPDPTLTEKEKQAVAVVSALSAAVAADMQTLAAVSLLRCSPGDTENVETDAGIRALVPVALSGTCVGAIQGALLTMGIVALVTFLGTAIFKTIRRIPWGDAAATLRFPGIFLAVWAFLQMGLVVCGGRLVLASPTSDKALGAIGVALGICVPFVFMGLAYCVVSRRCYRLAGKEAGPGTFWARRILLPEYELDTISIPISKAYSTVVGRSRLLSCFWAGLPLFQPVILAFVIFAQGAVCSSLLIVSGVLMMLVAAVCHIIFRPHRILAANILQGCAMALNAAILMVAAKLVGDPINAGALGANRVISMIQIGLSVLRILHSAGSAGYMFLWGAKVFTRVSTPSTKRTIECCDCDEMFIQPEFEYNAPLSGSGTLVAPSSSNVYGSTSIEPPKRTIFEQPLLVEPEVELELQPAEVFVVNEEDDEDDYIKPPPRKTEIKSIKRLNRNFAETIVEDLLNSRRGIVPMDLPYTLFREEELVDMDHCSSSTSTSLHASNSDDLGSSDVDVQNTTGRNNSYSMDEGDPSSANFTL